MAEVIDADTLGDFDEGFLMRALFGRKDDREAQYQAPNVLTCLDHLDRYVADGNEDRKGAVTKHFSGMCEYAQPPLHR